MSMGPSKPPTLTFEALSPWQNPRGHESSTSRSARDFWEISEDSVALETARAGGR